MSAKVIKASKLQNLQITFEEIFDRSSEIKLLTKKTTKNTAKNTAKNNAFDLLTR